MGQRGSGCQCRFSKSNRCGCEGECSVVLDSIQRVNVRDKFMSYITLFHSGRGYGQVRQCGRKV